MSARCTCNWNPPVIYSILKLISKLNKMITSCDFLRNLSKETWNRIGFTRSRSGLKVYEVTITQNLIYEIVRKHQSPDIKIFESINENANGNDIELFFRIKGGYLCFPTQSKILYKSLDYPKMEHGDQINDLINYAESKEVNGIPLYLLYNFFPDFKFNKVIKGIKCSASDYGCTLIDAYYLFDNFANKKINRKGKSKWRIPKFTDLHPAPAIPWFIPFCLNQNLIDKISFIQNISDSIKNKQISSLKLYTKNEILKDTKWNLLKVTEAQSEKIPYRKEEADSYPNTEKKSDVRIENDNFTEYGGFIPKFRIVFEKLKQ